MNAILEWVCDIAIYLIFITIVLQVIPKRFRKYISFFSGVVLISFVIRPITGCFIDNTLLSKYFEIEGIKQQLNDMENMIKFTENINEGKIVENYNEMIKEKVTDCIDEYGYIIKDIQIEWNLDNDTERYGTITNISLMLDEKRTQGSILVDKVEIFVDKEEENSYKEAEIKSMKNSIAAFYNLEESHINIMIQG